MAAKGRKGSTSGYSSDYTFININLVKADEDWLSACNLDEEFARERMDDLVSQGFKLSQNYDEKNNSFVCSLTDTRSTSDFYKYILTGRGATPFDAWISLAYKHFVLAQGDWLNIASRRSGNSSRFS